LNSPPDAGDVGGRVFTSRYRRGVLLAPGIGCIAAPLLVLPGAMLTKNLLAGVLAAVATLLVSAWIFNARRRSRPALVLSSEGLRLDGLGAIPWSDVLSARRDPDTRADPALLVRVRALPATSSGALVSPLWRVIDEDTLRVRIGILEDPAADVEEAVRLLLRRRL
jgi:hypothetical protein